MAKDFGLEPGPAAPTHIPTALQGPPDKPEEPTYVYLPGIGTVPAPKVDLGNIYRASKKNIKDLLTSGANLAGTAPFSLTPLEDRADGGLKEPDPKDLQKFTEASAKSPIDLAAGLNPNNIFHDAVERVQSLASPQNVALLGGSVLTAGMGGPAVALSKALGVYFTAQMAKGTWDDVKDAWQSANEGDLEGVARHLGAGTVDGLMTYFGIKHTAGDLNGLKDLFRKGRKMPATPWEFVHAGEIPPGEPPTPAETRKAIGPAQKLIGAPGEVDDTPPPAIPPSKTKTVTDATPNAPTAATKTDPESPETVAIQLDQLGKGIRAVVMFPDGTPVPSQLPEHTGITNDGLGNVYVYRKDLTSPDKIVAAAKGNKLNEVLGDRQFGLGAPDKSAVRDPVTVVVRDANGTEVQSIVTDRAFVDTTKTVAQRLMPEGGSVQVEDPAAVLGERADESGAGSTSPVVDAGPLESPAGLGEKPEEQGETQVAPAKPEPKPEPEPEPDEEVTPQDIHATRGIPQGHSLHYLQENAKPVLHEDGDSTGWHLSSGGRSGEAVLFNPDNPEDAYTFRPRKWDHEPSAALAKRMAEAYARLNPIQTPETSTELDPSKGLDRPALPGDEEHPERAREKVVARNEEDNTYGVIAQNSDGRWFGGLRDGDSGEMVGGKIFPSREEAEAFATQSVAGKAETKGGTAVSSPDTPEVEPGSGEKAPIEETDAEGPEGLAAPEEPGTKEEPPKPPSAGRSVEEQERIVQKALGDVSSALQHGHDPERLRDAAEAARQALHENPDVGENRKSEIERLATRAENTADITDFVVGKLERGGKVEPGDTVRLEQDGYDHPIEQHHIDAAKRIIEARGTATPGPETTEQETETEPTGLSAPDEPGAKEEEPEQQTTTTTEDSPLPAPVPPELKGVAGMIEEVYQKLKSGGSLGNVTELNRMAARHLGGSRTSGAWTPKDAFDAMEAGVNKYLLEIGDRLMHEPFLEGLAELRQLMPRITTQGVRTEEQLKRQQFSTPPTQSYLASKVAAVRPDDVVLESSAGNGGLVIWPKAMGAKVHVNEISERRRDMLKLIGFGDATAHDGELIHVDLDRNVKPTLAIINPPFSTSTQQEDGVGRNSNKFGFNHLEAALQRLEEGGRLVAILGGGQANEPNGGASFTGASGRWFQKIARRYNVRANVRINGKEYQKYGTNFATRIIVIDKSGATPIEANSPPWSTVVQGNVDTLEQAYELLRPVAESRPDLQARPGSRPGTRQQSGSGSGVASGPNGGAKGGGRTVRGGTSGDGQGDTGPQPGEPVGDSSGDESGEGGQPPTRVEPEPEPTDAGEDGSTQSPEGGTSGDDEERPVSDPEEVIPPPPVIPPERQDLESVERGEEPDQEDTQAYVTYRPTLKGAAHPGDIVETKAMATVPMPKITYKPALPKDVIESKVSAVQLEGISLVGQQNEILLPNGARSSALIGDGTGVGKGREAAGIIFDNWQQGRKRLVWVSKNWNLTQDAMRDLDGLGATDLMQGITKENGRYIVDKKGGKPRFVQQGDFPAEANLKDHKGVVFSTYTLLPTADKRHNTRLAQLEQYLRGDDDGEGAFIVFDESHLLKNAVPVQGGTASQVGVGIKNILDRLPKLRTASLSATAATDVSNLGYLGRLGLWGPGTAFPSGFQQFQNEIAEGGLAAMELVARELKAQGKYLSRTLSFKGVTQEVATHKLNPGQRAVYKTSTEAWDAVLWAAEDTIRNTTNGGGEQRGNFMSQLGGAQQRFFSVLLTTLKIPTAVEMAKKAEKEGMAVAISLINTNEASQNREMAKLRAKQASGDEDEEDLDFGPKEILTNLIKEHYPIYQYADAFDGQGRPIKVLVTHPNPDPTGRPIPVINEQAKDERDALVAKIERELHLPENPLDTLIKSLGGRDKVAELTGREKIYDRNKRQFIPRGEKGVPKDQINIIEMAKFQNGDKQFAVLSSAADTGISLHASNQAKNQRRRMMITLQVGWSADKAMQMLGRVHRTDQAHPPHYALLVSDMGGEMRFISTITRRLASLGALTKGQKDATGSNDLMSQVDFQGDQGKQAVQAFYDTMLRDQVVPGTGLRGKEILAKLRVLRNGTVPDTARRNVNKFLNNLLALEPDIQNQVYQYYFEIFQAAIQEALENNTLDTGVRSLPGDEFFFKQGRTIAKDPQTGATTHYQPVTVRSRIPRLSLAQRDQRMRTNAASNPRVVVSSDGKKMALLTDAYPIVRADGSQSPAVFAARPERAGSNRVDADNYDKWKTPEEFASQKKSTLETKLREQEFTLKQREEMLSAAEESEKARRKRAVQSRIQSLEARVQSAEEQFIRHGGSGDQDYYASARAEAQQSLAQAQKELADVENYKHEDRWLSLQIEDIKKRVVKAKEDLEPWKELFEDPEKWGDDLWEQLHEAAPAHEDIEHHFITGAVMKYWNAIRQSTYVRNSIYTATDSNTKKRIVGIEIPDGAIRNLLGRIEGGGSTVDTNQLITDVLRNNLHYQLEGGIEVVRGRVSREPVIELIPPNDDIARDLARMGVVAEYGINTVYYVPNRETAQVVSRILERYPVQPTNAGSTVQPSLRAERQPASRLQNTTAEKAFTPAQSTTWHIQKAAFEGVSLVNPEDQQNAIALVTNLSGIEFMGRKMAPEYADDTYGTKSNGVHISAANLPELIDKIEASQRTEAQGSQTLDQILAAAKKARAANKSLVVSVDDPAISDSTSQVALEEELDHAMQANAGLGTLRNHLRDSAMKFASVSPQGARAKWNLRLKYGYKFGSDNAAAAEIGARLMRNRIQELNLTPDEANQLAELYATLLEKEYGSERAAPIIRRLESAGTLTRGKTAEPDGNGLGSASGNEGTGDTGKAEPSLRSAARKAARPLVDFLDEEGFLEGSKESLRDLVNVLDPRRGTPTESLDAIYKRKGELDASVYQMVKHVNAWAKLMDKTMDRAGMIDFIDRMKTGRQQNTRQLDTIATFLRRVDDALYTEWQAHSPTAQYLENHYRVLWKIIPGSPQAKRRGGAGRSNMEGSRGFMKEHKLADMSEGIRLGGEPWTYNPIRMFVMHYSDVMKYVTAQRLWSDFKAMGVRKFVRGLGGPPPGYKRLDDRIAKVYFRADPGLVHAGEWWVEENAARLLNNMLGVDHIRKHAAGRALLAIKNGSTAAELSFSPFHLMFESSEAVSSLMAIGMREVNNLGIRQGRPGQIAKGFKTMATAIKAPASMAVMGGHARKAFENFSAFSQTPAGRNWLRTYPHAAQDVQMFFEGGGKLSIPDEYRMAAAKSVREYWKEASAKRPHLYGSAIIRALPALNDKIMTPLFEIFIPNLKVAFFLREYNLAKEEYVDRLASGEMTHLQLARKIVDSLDNRFGELNFDNLFWNRTFKTTMQLIWRSVTWRLGNWRGNYSAVKNLGVEVRRGMKERKWPLLDQDSAWLLSMYLWTALAGGVINYLSTGKLPHELKDIVTPYLGSIRVSFPSYARDQMHAYHDPWGYITSGLMGEIGRMIDVLENKDFYSNEIYGEDDSAMQKFFESAKQLVPVSFGLSSFYAATKEGADTTGKVAGFFGFPKAPAWVDQTDAEQLATKYIAKHREVGARTHQQADRADARRALRNIYRRGDDPTKEISKDIDKGLIRKSELPHLRQQAQQPKLLGLISSLSLPEQLKVYDAATDEEKEQIWREVKKKALTNVTKPYEWTPGTEKLAEKYFKIKPHKLLSLDSPAGF